MLAVGLTGARLVRGYLNDLAFDLRPQPELPLVRPPRLPGEPWLVLFAFPGPGRAEEGDAESKELRIDVSERSVGAEAAAPVLPSSPYVDADVDILEAFRDFYDGGVKREEVLCYERWIVGAPLDYRKTSVE